jgi:hypothetical protein
VVDQQCDSEPHECNQAPYSLVFQKIGMQLPKSLEKAFDIKLCHKYSQYLFTQYSLLLKGATNGEQEESDAKEMRAVRDDER